MPTLSWLHSFARLRRYGTRMAGAGGEVRATCAMGAERGWRAAGAGNGKRRRRARARWQGPAHAASEPGPAAGRKARSAMPQAAAAEKPGSAGRFFALCVISGRSTRKGGLGGKIRAPCILNRPIAPGNGCIRRGSCHSDLEKHTFRANIARKGAYFAHSAKREYIWCDSCQLGTRAPQCEGGCRVLWAARRMMASGRARRDEPRYHVARGATDYSARASDMAGAMDANGGSFLTVPGWCARRRRVVLFASSSLTASGWSLQGMVVAGTVTVAAGDGRCGDGWLRQGRKIEAAYATSLR